jgi:hypothetical protein
MKKIMIFLMESSPAEFRWLKKDKTFHPPLRKENLKKKNIPNQKGGLLANNHDDAYFKC